jgi:two-component system, NarL family, nitrate/nitrite response regulator NarL
VREVLATVSSSIIRVLVVDDHDLVVYALTKLLDRETDIEVVGSTGNGERAIELVASSAVDVVVLDRRLEDAIDAISLIGPLRDASEGTEVLVLSGASDEHAVFRAIEAGCRGFLSKDRPSSEVIDAVRAVASGQTVYPPGAIEGLERSRATAAAPVAELRPREAQVLQLLAEGRSTSEIADELYVSVNTVRNHVSAVMSKLGVHSRLEAVSEAVKLGLVRMG